MKNLDIPALRLAILEGMTISAEKMKRQKVLLGKKLVISEEGQIKVIFPDKIK